MAREKGNLLSCLYKAAHHCSPATLRLMLGAGCSVEDLQYRFNLIKEEAEIAAKQVARMKQVAEEKGYKEILDIINEDVEYGHNFG